MRKLIWMFGCVLLACFSVRAAGYRFFHPANLLGLPHQQVEALAQDGKGNIWIGTRNGLVRFDGYVTRCYYNEGTDNSLAHNFVRKLFVDSKQQLWICTQRGISQYRPASDDFKNYDLSGCYIQSIAESGHGKLFCAGDRLFVYDEQKDSFDALPSVGEGFILSLAVDKKDNLYVGTNSSIYTYDATLTKISRLAPQYYSDFITGFDGIMPMLVDHEGRLWIGRNGKGVMAIDLSNWHSEIFDAGKLSDGTVRTICEDRKNRIWLGTEGGLTVIRPDGGIDIIRQNFNNDKLLSDNAIYTVLCDRDNNIWVGSYFGGVDVMRGDHPFTWYEPGYTPINIKGKVARMMAEVDNGDIWIATEDGGLNIYNRRTETFSQFDRIPNMGNNIHSLYYDRNASDMWIGTFRHGLFKYNLSSGAVKRYELIPGSTDNSIFGFARQSNGCLWIATTQGLRYYDAVHDTFGKTGNDRLDNYFVYTLAVDSRDNVWVGTLRDGLFCIDGHNGKVTNYCVQNGGLRDNYVTCIYPASDGKIWIGTNNNGIQLFEPKTGTAENLNDEPILKTCTVCSISDDGNGHIWIGTSQGLFLYIPKTDRVVRFTTENGLPVNQMNFSSTLMASDGRMYVGTVNGLVSFNPSQIKSDTGSFDVHLKSLLINGEEVNSSTKDSPLKDELDKTSVLKLSYSQARSFSIEYGVIMPGNATTVNYQVWVEGIDKSWHNVGMERRFVGYKLPPGTYTIHVRANNSNEGWDKCPEKTITVVVAAPFYRTVWAYMFYVLVMALMVYYLLRSYKQRLQEKNKMKMAIMEKEKIEEIDRAKSDFFTTVSHELKTPLSLIVAPLKSIQRDNMTEACRKHLETAIQNTQKMEQLIGELVTLNKVESDNFPFYIQKGNPLEFMDRIAMSFRDTASGRQLIFRVVLEDNGEDVWFSPSYLEKIVNNLLSNAFKFTSEGGTVTVKSSITTRSDNHTYLYLDVTDTGIGIAREEQEKIFGRFYQTKRGYSANNHGWGIGLALVKRLVDIHKGTIEVESEIGHGTTFRVWLNVDMNAFDKDNIINEDKVIVPLKDYNFTPTMTDMQGHDDEAGSVSDNEKLSILIVEDNRDLLMFLKDYFAQRYNVFTAENGVQALAITDTESIQLVISDVMMPEMDGVELCRRLKEDVATSHIPVVLLTAKNEQEDVVTGYKSGAEAYVSKPFDPQVLDLQVNNIIQLVKIRQQEIVDADTEDMESTSLGPLDKEFMQQVNELIDRHIDDSDFSIADITKELAISRSLLHTKMKNLVNMSMGEYIRRKRLNLACRLLKDGYNVSETAYRSGFADPNYFSKAFKKQIGKSPTEFLAEQRK